MLSPSSPPYALAAPTFRFRALASGAALLPKGGDRELALVTFVCARLAWDAVTDRTIAGELSRIRGRACRGWIQGLSLPSPTKVAFFAVADAIANDDRAQIAAAWDRAVLLAARVLDHQARSELKEVSARIGESS